MEIKAIDFFLCTICISLLLFFSITTVWLLSIEGFYAVLIDFFFLLICYGTYSALFLALMRRFMPYPIGQFTLDSREFTYWLLNAVLVDLAWKALTPFNLVFTERLFLSAFGARTGKNLAIGGVFRDHPLIELADFATIGQNAVIVGHAITQTYKSITLKPVRIGRNAVVGINCVVMPGVTLGENAVLAPGAVAIINTVIPDNELWGGIPARKIKDLLPEPEMTSLEQVD